MQQDVLTAQKQAVPHEFDRVARRYDLLTGPATPATRSTCAGAPSACSSRRPPAPRSSTCAAAPACPPSPWSSTYPNATISGLDASAGMLAVAAQKPWASEGPLRLRRRHGPRRQRPPRPLRRHPHGLRHPQHARRRPVPRPPVRPPAPRRHHLLPRVLGPRLAQEPPHLERRRPRHHHPRRPPHLPRLRHLPLPPRQRERLRRRRRLRGPPRPRRLHRAAPQTMDGWQAGIVHSFIARRPA
jgi:hypothetical protein